MAKSHHYRKVNKESQEFKDALVAAQAPLPPPSDWQYAEIQMFHNRVRRGRETEFALKIGATVETDYRRLRKGTRRKFCDHRWASLSEVEVFSRNCTPSRKAGAPLTPWERELADGFKAAARDYDRNRVADDQPAALLGWLGVRLLGAGTPRCRMMAFVTWEHAGGEWVPVVLVSHPMPDAGAGWRLRSRANAAGRGDRACRWLDIHYSPAYRAHLAEQKTKADERKASQGESMAA